MKKVDDRPAMLRKCGQACWDDWRGDDKPPLYTLIRETCSSWLESRASRHGFKFDEENLAVDAYQQHSEKNGRLRFSTVDFTGELTVTDPGAFGIALRCGIGHAKGFGCGLLHVRRI